MKSGDVVFLLLDPNKQLYRNTFYVVCKMKKSNVTLVQDEHGEFHQVNIDKKWFVK